MHEDENFVFKRERKEKVKFSRADETLQVECVFSEIYFCGNPPSKFSFSFSRWNLIWKKDDKILSCSQ